MKIKYVIIFIILINIVGMTQAKESQDSLYTTLNSHLRIEKMDCDTLVDCNGYSIRLVKNAGQVRTVGLNLFSDNIKKSFDNELLSFIETSLLAQSLGIRNDVYGKVMLKTGQIDDFKNINPDTDCSISTVNAKSMKVIWTIDGKRVTIELPVGYNVAKVGNRTEIEDALIAKLKKGDNQHRFTAEIDKVLLEPFKDDLYIFPGNNYLNKEITSTLYFQNGESLTPVWSKDYPLESMADLFLYPSTMYGEPKIEVKVLKHEYGESETFTISLSHLLAVMEDEGCSPYWGVESFENGKLKGALFLFNRHQGYDHVISVECNPEEIIAGTGTLKARASLYIPTNNVDNLFQPYRNKTENEKINYKK